MADGRVRRDIERKFFAVRVLRPLHWPTAAVAAPSLEVSMARLDGAWSNLG